MTTDMVTIPDLIVRRSEMFLCPACAASVDISSTSVNCRGCGKAFSSQGGVPLLFWEGDSDRPRSEVTERVKAFYEETPFPNYDDLDSRWTLRDKARRGVLAQLLDDQIPVGAHVLEVGCGTGQLSNLLGLRSDREVFGADMCLNSLQLGQTFARGNQIDNVAFVQMNLFQPVFKPGSFDVVICNGVLHHTADPFGGFQSIASLVKEGGVILIGLYNRFGRLKTNLRRTLFRVTGNRITSLDPRMKVEGLGEVRKRTWFLDQYKHPHESQHTMGEVLRWFDRSGIQFLNGIPKLQPFKKFSGAENLFRTHSKGNVAGRALVQLKMAVDDREGGFYMMIGRKTSS